ncbi:hypothetical protein ACFCYN_04535 [Gottfriedia sp. NPDC056225]|uniref:hypothetical protein n=1 Tax=Gottfriedia sp. NPDC056225 TaxID=3345751 RepID=UPI0035DE6908
MLKNKEGEEKYFFPFLISNIMPYERKEKNEFEIKKTDCYIQFHEILFYEQVEDKLYLYEYNYHFGKRTSGEKEDDFYIRYEREVAKKNPPEKEIEHLHAGTKKTHYPSRFITFEEFLVLIKVNWDFDSQMIDITLYSIMTPLLITCSSLLTKYRSLTIPSVLNNSHDSKINYIKTIDSTNSQLFQQRNYFMY